MEIADLASLPAGLRLKADLAIVGSGPAGLTIARQFFGTAFEVLILESGQLKEDSKYSSLNRVESIGDPVGEAEAAKRTAFHGASAPWWSHDSQTFGVRCRVFGGSTAAWAGKSAAFDASDFATRPWVPESGWPFGLDYLAPFLDRAAEELNLGPNCYDERLWERIGIAPPKPQLDPAVLQSFFWQFARSRVDKMDVMRFGPEYAALEARNVRVLVNATVTEIETNAEGTAFQSLKLSSIENHQASVSARAVVLAAGGIENPRLLLASNRRHPRGLGNAHDAVGRYLMDHPSARVGRFDRRSCQAVVKRFGFYGVSHQGRTHMYMHGVTPAKTLMQREGLLNCAAYMLEERALDDPWEALKRLLRRDSQSFGADLLAVCRSPGLLAKGVGMRAFASGVIPDGIKETIISAMMRYNPNFVVREYQSRGLPHKLDELTIDAISEQVPDRESRITLSDKRDLFGIPLARANWRIGDASRRSLLRLAKLMVGEFTRVGLPAPVLEDWVNEERPDDAVIIDMGHILGTTRMSVDPKRGPVDPSCQVHGVANVYIAGGSVFPTSGHANPTLMILALAIRLADHLKLCLSRQRCA